MTEEAEVYPMGDITRYILRAVGNKYDLNMEDEEEGGIYEGDSDIYGEECNDLEFARDEAMGEK